MDTVNLYEAKTNLSSLVDRAAAGEEIIIAKAGRPLARLVPIEKKEALGPRPLGLLKGQVMIGDDFDDPLPEDIMDAFEGRSLRLLVDTHSCSGPCPTTRSLARQREALTARGNEVFVSPFPLGKSPSRTNSNVGISHSPLH